MTSASNQSLDEGKTVETDLDRLVGREFSSGKRHTARIRKESWIPWLTFTDLWNSANAYNLALFSALSYKEKKSIERLFEKDLRNKKSSKIKLGANSLTNGEPRKLLTRNALQENQFKQPEFWNLSETNTQAFAVHSADAVLISIRGTEEAHTEDGLEDWIQNIQAPSVPFDEGPAAYWTEQGEKLHVHEGFYEAFRSLKGGLVDYLKKHHETDEGENKNVFICGHSLGGAVGLLTAAFLTSSWNLSPVLYTYGMPRVGERAFAEHYGPDGKEPLIHHRHVHHQDIVPQGPPPQYEGNPLFLLASILSPVGILSQLNWDSRYVHHGLLTYLPPVSDKWSKPIIDPHPAELVSLTEKGANLPSLFIETSDRATTFGHQLEDHHTTSYATVLRRRLDLEMNTFLDNACGDAKAKGSRIGALDSSSSPQIDTLRSELVDLWDTEEDLLALFRDRAVKKPVLEYDEEIEEQVEEDLRKPPAPAAPDKTDVERKPPSPDIPGEPDAEREQPSPDITPDHTTLDEEHPEVPVRALRRRQAQLSEELKRLDQQRPLNRDQKQKEKILTLKLADLLVDDEESSSVAPRRRERQADEENQQSALEEDVVQEIKKRAEEHLEDPLSPAAERDGTDSPVPSQRKRILKGLKQLRAKQEKKADELFAALKKRAATFEDERSFLIQTPEWPEFPCQTLKRFQGTGNGTS